MVLALNWRTTLRAAVAVDGMVLACTLLANQSEGDSAVDGMVLACGTPEDLVQPLRPGADEPRTAERLLYAGYTQDSDKRILDITSRSLAVCLHTVSAKVASSFVKPGMKALSRTSLLANGRERDLPEHDANTQH